MNNIAVVEDIDGEAERLISFINDYGKENAREFNVVRYRSGDELLADYRSVFSVIFMDIQMPGMNGMDAAFEIRKRDKTVSIIFITRMVQYAQKGYEVDAVSFLVKPVNYYDFSMKFKKALDIYLMNEEKGIMITLAGGMRRISTDKLMYVEIINHRLYYHLVDDVIEMTGVLSNVEEELKKYGFLRCNKCYLVNPKFIVAVKNSEVQVGNAFLQISRPRRATFMAELANWFAGLGGGNG